MKLTKSKLKAIISEEHKKVVKEYGAPVFSPKKQKSQYARKMPVADEDDRTEIEKAASKDKKLKEDIGLENQWEEISDLIAEIMNHSSDHEAALKAERAFELLEEIRNAL